MNALFIISLIVALFSALKVVTRQNAVHALLYLIVFFFSFGIIFYLVGAPFVAVLEIIIYAGAIVTLFIFVVMMLNVPELPESKKRSWLRFSVWWLPVLLLLILQVEFLVIVLQPPVSLREFELITPERVGFVLITKYTAAIELAGMLLMAGIIGAYHLGKRKKKIQHRYIEKANKL